MKINLRRKRVIYEKAYWLLCQHKILETKYFFLKKKKQEESQICKRGHPQIIPNWRGAGVDLGLQLKKLLVFCVGYSYPLTKSISQRRIMYSKNYT